MYGYYQCKYQVAMASDLTPTPTTTIAWTIMIL